MFALENGEKNLGAPKLGMPLPDYLMDCPLVYSDLIGMLTAGATKCLSTAYFYQKYLSDHTKLENNLDKDHHYNTNIGNKTRYLNFDIFFLAAKRSVILHVFQ